PDGAIEAFRSAIVIARQSRMRINLNRGGPGFPIIRGPGNYHLRVSQAPPSPSDVQIAGELALRIVRDNVRLVLERNSVSSRLFPDRNGVRLPGFTTVQGPPHEDAIARRPVRPIVELSQLVERDVTDKCMTLIVKSRRHVARDSIVLGIDSFGCLPAFSAILRIRSMRVVLIYGYDLLRILRVHRNSRLSEVARCRGQIENF